MTLRVVEHEDVLMSIGGSMWYIWVGLIANVVLCTMREK